MRLLHAETFEIASFDDDNQIPGYAILSHTWGSPRDEVSFQDMSGDVSQSLSDLQSGGGLNKRSGWLKIQSACQQALEYGCQYIWIDTCCINSSSSAELQEAINSMFRWYQSAEVCLAYLEDVNTDDSGNVDASFQKARWFSRGWTLQELLAPSEVIFFDQTWKEIGTKRDLCNAIAKITGIEVRYISDSTSSVFVKGGQDLLSAASVAERMSWAAERQTTRTEDLAYCLLGIFDICMPMLYGEGARAFTRLQEEIMKVTDDSSLLTWGYQYPLQECPTDGSSILAPSPAHFKHCRGIANRMPEGFGWPSFMMSQRGLQASLPICTDQTHEHLVYGILGCGPSKSTEEKSFLALPLVSTRACHSWRQDEDPHEAEYLRPFWCRPVLVSKDFFKSAEFRTLTIRRPSARNKALRRLPFSVSLRATAPHSFDVLGMYPPQTFGGQFTSLSRNSAASTEQRKSRIWRRFKHREQKRPIEAVRWIGHREVGQRMIHAKIASVPLLVVIDYEAEVIDETEWPAWDYKVSCRVFELPREFSLELLHELAVTQGFGRLRKRKVSSRGNASLVKLKDDSETLIALEFKRIQKLVATTIIFITVLDASLVHQFEELSVQELQAYEHNSDQ